MRPHASAALLLFACRLTVAAPPAAAHPEAIACDPDWLGFEPVCGEPFRRLCETIGGEYERDDANGQELCWLEPHEEDTGA